MFISIIKLTIKNKNKILNCIKVTTKQNITCYKKLVESPEYRFGEPLVYIILYLPHLWQFLLCIHQISQQIPHHVKTSSLTWHYTSNSDVSNINRSIIIWHEPHNLKGFSTNVNISENVMFYIIGFNCEGSQLRSVGLCGVPVHSVHRARMHGFNK